jgi:hypothetical protein
MKPQFAVTVSSSCSGLIAGAQPFALRFSHELLLLPCAGR